MENVRLRKIDGRSLLLGFLIGTTITAFVVGWMFFTALKQALETPDARPVPLLQPTTEQEVRL